MSITCKICNTEFSKIIPWQHLKTHSISSSEYKLLHGQLYSTSTLEKFKSRTPVNKGKKVTNLAHLEKLRGAIALREKKFENGDIKRGRCLTNLEKLEASKKQKDYAAANPDAMKQRAAKAVNTKINLGYDFGSPMRGKTHTDTAKQKIKQSSQASNQKKSIASNELISQKIKELGLTQTNSINSCQLELHCNVCNSDFSFTKQYFHPAKFKNSICPGCFPRVAKTSKGENELFAFIKNICPDAIQSYRQTYHSGEIDIYVPSLNTGFEFNGLYWHSEDVLTTNNQSKTKDYEKLLKAKSISIRLIQIFEDEWHLKQQIVQSRIQNILGKTQQVIYARKCTVAEIDSASAAKFCNHNHIMGAGRSNVRYGLFQNGLLLSVMTFSKSNLSRKIDGWELNRFCTAIGHQVVGGASKLFSAFVRNANPTEIVSYSDNRWSDGKLYHNLGFGLTHSGAPNYWYISPNCAARIHRFTLRKNSNDDPLLTESILRKQQGYSRVWDSGSSRWQWRRPE